MDEYWLRATACEADMKLSAAVAFLGHILGVDLDHLSVSDAQRIVSRLSATEWTIAEANRYATNAVLRDEEE